MWKQFMAQGVPCCDSQDTFEMKRGDIWGGRLVAGLGFGRVGVELRLDAAGLKDQFNANDPATFKTLELYAATHYVLLTSKQFQLGPVFVAGSIVNMDTDHPDAWTGVGVDVLGGGVRIAGFGSEVELLFAYTSFLYNDPAWRAVLVAHVRLTDRLYVVGDGVTGGDGFVRAGFAVRAF
jgi:hypothetical protein